MAEQKLSKSFVRFLKAVRAQRDLIDKIFGKTAQEQKAMEAITFGVIENGTQVWFTPKAYRAILMAVAKGDISIVPDATLGADAAYDDLNDRLRIPEALYNTPIGRGMIVHELTHAIVDMAPATNWTNLTNECVAFIAQAIYYKVSKTPLTYFAPYPDDVKLHGAARDLVDYYYFGDPMRWLPMEASRAKTPSWKSSEELST